MSRADWKAAAVGAVLLAAAWLLAGCAGPARPPEGAPVPSPPADEEMCRERFRPNLCPASAEAKPLRLRAGRPEEHLPWR